MITLALAQELKNAGLVWKTAVNDFFGIPDREMDSRIFVLTDLMANMDIFRGWPVVTFHGAPEWALDYILTSEVVWLPSEAQLRGQLEEILLGEPEMMLQLTYQPNGYSCQIIYQKERLSFNGQDASEAYARALLHILLLTTE